MDWIMMVWEETWRMFINLRNNLELKLKHITNNHNTQRIQND